MSRDPRAQQKKKERRNAREKKKKQLARQETAVTPLALVARFPDAPVRACSINAAAFTDTGIGNLFVVRELPTGVCVAVTFLVDLKCLGVKNVAFHVLSRSGVAEFARKMYASEPAEPLTAPEAKKLVLDAVAFAAKYGLHPHADYAKALLIFTGIDETGCAREFEFGQDGKPLYVNGPHDSPTFQRRIRDTLDRTAGPGNWDFVLMTGDPGGMSAADIARLALQDEEDVEFEDDDEDDFDPAEGDDDLPRLPG